MFLLQAVFPEKVCRGAWVFPYRFPLRKKKTEYAQQGNLSVDVPLAVYLLTRLDLSQVSWGPFSVVPVEGKLDHRVPPKFAGCRLDS